MYISPPSSTNVITGGGLSVQMAIPVASWRFGTTNMTCSQNSFVPVPIFNCAKNKQGHQYEFQCSSHNVRALYADVFTAFRSVLKCPNTQLHLYTHIFREISVALGYAPFLTNKFQYRFSQIISNNNFDYNNFNNNNYNNNNNNNCIRYSVSISYFTNIKQKCRP